MCKYVYKQIGFDAMADILMDEISRFVEGEYGQRNSPAFLPSYFLLIYVPAVRITLALGLSATVVEPLYWIAVTSAITSSSQRPYVV